MGKDSLSSNAPSISARGCLVLGLGDLKHEPTPLLLLLLGLQTGALNQRL